MKEICSPKLDTSRVFREAWILAGACVLVVLIALLLPRPDVDEPSFAAASVAPNPGVAANAREVRRVLSSRHQMAGESAFTAEEIVARKLTQFGKNRRQIVHAIARHGKVTVPDGVERFFDAVASGRWEEIDATHGALLAPGAGPNQPGSAELHQIWRAIQEAWGAAREAHNWPAQKLLDYGEAVLGSLRPGMIYVGGTDPGCFIPTLLNETSEGERHITLTQNALADGTYLDYLRFLHGDRMATLTHDDSQRAFQDYLADAQKRLQHDQQFPDEPKQLRPGEEVQIADNRVQVSGQIAVMAINEKLLQTLLEKNPDVSFAMEESFAFPSLYSNAAPLGPIMELRVQEPQNSLTAEGAAQSLDYWRATAQQLLADPQTPVESDPRKAYSKMACAQAGLLLDRNYTSDAEQVFRIAHEICPSSPEAVFRYVNVLMQQNRVADAVTVAETGVRAAPNNEQFRGLMAQLKAMKK